MTPLLLVSHIAVWVLVLFLLIAVFALARQVGLLHRKMGTAGARMLADGPAIGDEAPELDAVDLLDRPVIPGWTRGKLSLLLFVSPGCSTCGELMPAVRALYRAERKYIDVMVLSLAKDIDKTREFAAAHPMEPIPVVSGRDIAELYQVKMPPYGVLVGVDRKVKAKGLVNSLEHLESLVTAARVGFATIESAIESHAEASSAGARPRPSAAIAADEQLPA